MARRSGYVFNKFDLVDANIPLLQWKKYLTLMQIIQFVIDLNVVYFGSKFDPSVDTFHPADLTCPLSLYALCGNIL